MAAGARRRHVVIFIALSISVILSAGLGVAINVATSDMKPWPGKLELARQHPWIAALVLILASCAVAYLLWSRSDAQSQDGSTASSNADASGGGTAIATGDNAAVNIAEHGSIISISNITASEINVWAKPPAANPDENIKLRQSHARTRARLRAIGLNDQQVEQVRAILSSRPLPQGLDTLQPGRLLVLAGELGSGKSEVAETWFRQAAESAISNENAAAIPVWISAKTIAGTIRDEINRYIPDWGQFTARGCDVVIDELDAIPDARRVNTLLLEASEFADANDRVRIVATIRPGYSIAEALQIDVPLLTADEALELIRAASSDARSPDRNLPPAIIDVIKIPLFALLTARHISILPQPFTRATLLQLTAEQGVQIAQARTGVRGEGSTGLLLRRIAVASINGMPLKISEVSDADRLLQSRLIAEANGDLTFPIAVLEQYFAGQAIMRGEVNIDLTSAASLTRWRYAIAVALAASDADDGTDLMDRVTRSNPAIASWLVDEAIATTTGHRRQAAGEDALREGAVKDTSQQAIEAGRSLRRAMNAWIHGLGAVGTECGPTGPDGDLRPLGVYLSESGVFEAVWAQGSLPDVFVLHGKDAPAGIQYGGIFRLPPGWGPGRGGALPRSVKWEWHASRETLRAQLEYMFKRRKFETREGSFIESETFWKLARVLTSRYANVNQKPLDPEVIQSPARELAKILATGPEKPYFTVNGKHFRKRDLDLLLKECERLIANGRQFSRPVPGPDIPNSSGGWAWDLYSKERLLEAVREVWREGFKAYYELVADHFPTCGRSLGITALGPVKVEGYLVFDDEPQYGPVLDYVVAPVDPSIDIDQLPPLRPGDSYTEPFIDINIAPESGVPRRFWMGPLPQRSAGILGATYGNPTGASTSVDVFGDRPATDLAYSLLAGDLASFGFVSPAVHLSES